MGTSEMISAWPGDFPVRIARMVVLVSIMKELIVGKPVGSGIYVCDFRSS